jgi:ribosomal-protein-alanine acetyltransferase
MANEIDNVIVEEAELVDASWIRRIALDAEIDAWTDADYSEEISRPNSYVLRATDNAELVGFIVSRIVPGKTEDHPDADLYNIAVDHTRKRQGIGTKLLVSLLEGLASRRVSSVWLEVRESNSGAISFYKRHGFKPEITRPNFYSNPTENAVIMRRLVTPDRNVSEP